MGRPSIGVRGMKLKGTDEVVEMDVVKDPNVAELLVIMENGLGKMTTVQEYRFQARGGSGVKTANITAKTGKIVGAKILDKDTDADLVIISKAGQVIRLHSKQIPSQGRTTQGVYLMRMRPNDKVASISVIDNKELQAAAALAGVNPEEFEEGQESIEDIQETIEEVKTVSKKK
jgi:DNA gyrase subunit A